MERRYNCHHHNHPHTRGAAATVVGKCGVNKQQNMPPQASSLAGGGGGWWDSVLTPPLSAASSQSSNSCAKFMEKHTQSCFDGCNKLISTPEEERFIWDRTPYDQIVCYETRCHLEDRYHHGNPHPGDTTYHLGDNTYHHGNRSNHPSERSNLRLEVSSQHCSQCDCDPYNAYNTSQYTCRAQQQQQSCCVRPAPPYDCSAKGGRPLPAPCDCSSSAVYTRFKKQQQGCKMAVSRTHSPLMNPTPPPGLPLNEGDLRSLVPLTFNTDAPSTAQLRFPQISYTSNNSNRARAFSCEAVLSSSTKGHLKSPEPSEQPETKNAITSPTMPSDVQSDAVTSTSPTDNTEGEEVEEVSGFTNTVNRATSPFIVKMASQVQQIPNDPAVKSLVKSIVKFNDVEYQVPTKIIRRSKSQEMSTDTTENIYWEAEETPLKPPQQSGFFCTPRRKEKRNVSADSVGSIAPLLKYKRSGGFFKMTSSNKSSKQGKHSSCLNSKVFKGMMLSRKTADSIHPTVGGGGGAGGGASSLGVSRVRIFNANSEQYEAATGRHTVQVPAPAPTNEASTCGTEKEKSKEGKSKQSALGRFFKSRKSEGGVRWKINPEYYAIREGESQPGGYVLPDDTFESVEL